MLIIDCYKNFEIFNVYVLYEWWKGCIGVEFLNGDKIILVFVKFVLV